MPPFWAPHAPACRIDRFPNPSNPIMSEVFLVSSMVYGCLEQVERRVSIDERQHAAKTLSADDNEYFDDDITEQLVQELNARVSAKYGIHAQFTVPIGA